MAAALVPRELASWSLTAVSLGMLEGGLLGVIVKNQFDGVAPDAWVNLAVALVAGAPAFANLFSFYFASAALGQDKLRYLSRLMAFMGLCLFALMIPGRNFAGLCLFTILAVSGRVAWSGILTVRAAVWRANYQRRWRGRVTAKIVQISSLLVAATSAVAGLLMDWQGESWRYLLPVAGICAFIASRIYLGARVRRHQQLIRAELAEQRLLGSSLSLNAMLQLLRGNPDFRNYMIGMMVFGSGNLMVIAMLVLVMNTGFDISRFDQVLITSSLPLMVLCFSIRLWAPLLDSRHIFSYRALHSWNFVAANAVLAAAALSGVTALLWLGAALLGSAYAGGQLGWSLGTNDFSTDGDASLYMAVHVSLTGVRGLVMPIVGVSLFQWLERLEPGSGGWSMLLPLGLTLIGSFWFVHLHLEHSRRQVDA